jgi:hypothetical protein
MALAMAVQVALEATVDMVLDCMIVTWLLAADESTEQSSKLKSADEELPFLFF